MRIGDIFNSASAVAYIVNSEPYANVDYLGKQFFPDRKRSGIDLKWIKGSRGAGVALKQSNFDALATIRQRQGFTLNAEEMPFFRESMLIKEHDMMEILRAQDSNDPYVREVLENVYDDVLELYRGAEIVAERMRMQLLSGNGGNPGISVALADNTIYTYDYDKDNTWIASNYVVLSGTNTWTAANKSSNAPLDDLQTGITALRAKGYRPAYLIMNSATFANMKASDQIKSAIVTFGGISLSYITDKIVTDVIAQDKQLTVLLYDKTYVDVDGSTKKFFPDGYATIVSEGNCGNTYYGVTPEERTLLGDPKVDVSVIDGNVAIAVQTTYGPPVNVKTTASEIVLPSFEGMDGVYVIKTA